MRWRNLPPLSSLRAFAAFAQTGNVVAAGDALGVSHAAISQQLRALEKHLGAQLLDRQGRQMQLTDAGARLGRALEAGFGAMLEACEEISGAGADRPLHISATPAFAASWLMPRLPTFRAAHPSVDLMIDPSPKLTDLNSGEIDMAIRYGVGPWDGVEAELLLQTPLVVVAAPSLVGEGPIDDIRDLARFPWIEEFGTSESSRWLRRFGVAEMALGVLQLPGNLLIDGARDGQGVAVTVREFVKRDIAAGRLRELHVGSRQDAGYHIATRPGIVQRPALKNFVKWLRREAREALNQDRS